MHEREVQSNSGAGAGRVPGIAYLLSHPGQSTLASLSIGAAAIHFAASPDHFGEWAPYGVAFAVLAWFQVLWAATHLVGGARPLAIAAIFVNAGAVIVWIWSRTIGLPIGPDPGSTESVGFPDALSSGLEALLVLGLLADGTPFAARLAARSARSGAALALGIVTVVALTLFAFMALAPQAMPMG